MHPYPRFVARLALGLLVIAPAAVQALQLGGLTVDSKLGQPFAARVELLVGPRDDVAALEAQVLPAPALASGGAVADIGAQLAVRVVRVADGGAFLSLRGTAAVSEPIAGFRVRVAHGDRAQIASYTALLDPPVAARPASRRAQAQRPARAPVIAARPSAPAPRAAPLADAIPAGAQTYGPVRSGETLWKIARALRRDETVSVQSVLEALHRANPSAFAGGNIDRLKLGAVLVVPAEIAGTPAVEAPAPAPVAVAPVAAPAPAAATPAAAPPAPAPVEVLPVTPAPDPQALRAAAQAVVATGGTASAAADAGVPAPVAVAPVAAAPAPAPEAAPAPAAVAAPAANAPAPVAVAADPVVESAGPPAWLLAAGALLLLGLLALSGRAVARRLARHSEDKAHRAAEEARVAALAEKTALFAGVKSRDGKVVPMRRPKEAAPVAVDPLAEVDLNLAYGRYGEAEQTLRQVLDATPHNHQARLKLAEVYYTTGRGEAYCALAAELHGEYRDLISDTDWHRVVEMGRVVAPEHPLFGGPALVGAGQPPRA